MIGLRRTGFAVLATIFRALAYPPLRVCQGFEWLADRCEERARQERRT